MRRDEELLALLHSMFAVISPPHGGGFRPLCLAGLIGLSKYHVSELAVLSDSRARDLAQLGACMRKGSATKLGDATTLMLILTHAETIFGQCQCGLPTSSSCFSTDQSPSQG